MAAGVLWVLPLEAARERYERNRTLERAIATFRQAVSTWERRSHQQLPSVDEWGEVHLVRYLSALDEYMGNHDGGTWVHPMVETPTGQWPRTTDSTVEVWIIRSLDTVGIPRNRDMQKTLFLSLAERLAELIADHCPPGVSITTTRKNIQNHAEFTGCGTFQWNRPADR